MKNHLGLYTNTRKLHRIVARVLQLLVWLLGVSILAWAFLDPRFRDAEGFLEGAFALPISVGIVLLIGGWAAMGRMKLFAFWFSLALVGQAVALQLIEAGPALRYQHYKPIDRLLSETHPLLLGFLALQTILVLVGISTRWPKIWGWISQNFKTWQLLGIGVAFVLSSAALSRALPIYVTELLFATFIQTVNLGNIVLVAWAVPAGTLVALRSRFNKLLGQPSMEGGVGKAGYIDRFVVLAAVWVTVLATTLSYFSYERLPHVPDEVIYLYHARYLAAGELTVPAPPVPDAFSFYLIPYQADQWYSIFPPGWPALLAVGVLIGLPWLVNPVLAGLNVLLAFIFVKEIYDHDIGRMVVFLLCFSPWYIFMGINFMAHTFTLTCVLLAAVGIAWARRTRHLWWAALAGCAVGMVSLIRPLDGVMVAGLLGLWVIGIGGRRLKFSSVVAFVLSAIVVGAIVFPYNKQITSDFTVFPLMAYYEEYFGPKTNALGFGSERGLGWAIDAFPGHSPGEALINATLNTFSINVDLFGWSIGSLIIVILLLFSRRFQRQDHLMLFAIVGNVGIYSLYWFSGGPDFGARYWYLMLIPLVVLTVRGMQMLVQLLEVNSASSENQNMRVMIAVLSLCLLALVTYFPWRSIDKYHHFRGVRPDIRQLAKEYDFGRSLVLIRGNLQSDYLSAWTYNPLDPYADAPVYAWDRNPELRAQLIEAYPDRPVWIVQGSTITSNGFKVVSGPLLPQKMNVNEQDAE